MSADDLVKVPEIDFQDRTGDELVNSRKAFGLQRLGSTGPSTSVSSAVRCVHVIDGAKVYHGKSWWSRQCKRMTSHSSRLCWQHR